MDEREGIAALLRMLNDPSPNGAGDAAGESKKEAAFDPVGLLSVLSGGASSANACGEDERAVLLRAMRPFLSPCRQSRVDSAITAMHVADLLRVAIYGEACK